MGIYELLSKISLTKPYTFMSYDYTDINRIMTPFMEQGKQRVKGLYDDLQGQIAPVLLHITKLTDQLEKLKTQSGYHKSESLKAQIEGLTKNIESINGLLSKGAKFQGEEIFDADIERAKITLNTIMNA
jgi:hypothetical protein